jgi:hypothetical protein
MSFGPDWLPDTFCVDGEFRTILGQLYSLFYRDFVETKPRLESMDVFFDRTIKPGEVYEDGFWHLVEREHILGQPRSFDPRRAERLPWCKAAITNCLDEVFVKFWKNEERGQVVCYVWLEQHDYVIILTERVLKATTTKPEKKIAFLKTAYFVDGESKKRSLRRKYSERLS